jgi:hypothetical protein
MDPVTGAWTPDDGDADDAYSLAYYISTMYDTSLYSSPPFTTQCAPTVSTMQTSFDGWWFGETYGVSKYTSSTTLSSEYTDTMLRAEMMSMIPATFGGWLTASGAFTSAYYGLDGNHVNASGLRSQYYFHISDCQPHTSYFVLWDEVTTYSESGQPPLVKHRSEEVESNGDPVAGTDSSMHTAEVPVTPGEVTEANIRVVYAPWDNFGS